MLSQRTAVFRSNENKDFLRDTIDHNAIRIWYESVPKQKLRYLGLPAAEMLDIISWESFLGTFTTIEREEDQQHLMFLRANVIDVEHRLKSLYGDFDQILINGVDRNGHSPDWPFDLVNLDYFGGFIYSNLSRPKAIRKLIQNQGAYKRSFLLLVTQHLRDGDTIGAKSSLLENARRTLKSLCLDNDASNDVDKVIDWFADPSTPDVARQALYMNLFLRDIGEHEQFDVKCRPAISYVGTGNAAMVHFITELRHRPAVAHRVESLQRLVEVINLNVQLLASRKLKDLLSRPLVRFPGR